MDKFHFKEYIAGAITGLSQVIIGYPLDTIKTNIQNGFNGSLNVSQLLRGIKYPMIASVISNTAFFGNYDILYKYTNSTWISGGLTGAIGALVLNPFEIRKVRQQYVLQPDKFRGHSGIYGGLNYTITREVIGNAFYFTAYYYSKNELNFHPFFAGGIAGLNSWFWSYPLDVIKTRKQINLNLTFLELIKKGKLFNGLSIALTRGFIVNGFSFWVYDTLKKVFNK